MAITPTKPKSYPAFVSPESGRVRFDLTPSVESKKHVVYQIEDAETERSYVGKTGQEFKKRMQQHQSAIHTPKERGQTDLYQAIRDNPTRFSVRVIAQADKETLDDREAECIAKVDAVRKGYNKNKGRGGGATAEAEDKPYTPPPADTTPKKYYPLKERTDGSIEVEFTPSTSGKKRVIYVLRNQETDERYVGKTTRVLKKRIGEHLHFANHPEKEVGQKRLYKEIREKTDQFAVGILEEVDPASSLDKAERHFIRVKRSKTRGYNSNAGGGGGS